MTPLAPQTGAVAAPADDGDRTTLLAALGLPTAWDGHHPPVSPVERVKQNLDLFEAAVKATVAVEVSFLLDRGCPPAPVRTALAASLARPSLGHWIEYHRLALPALATAGWPATWDWILPAEERHRLVALRNTFAHSGGTRLLEDPAFARAVDAAGQVVAAARLMRHAVASAGPHVPGPDRLRQCLVDLPDLGCQVSTSPLLYWQQQPDAPERMLVFQSCSGGRRAAWPTYTCGDGHRPVRLKAHGTAFQQRLPLARWRNPVVEPLGALGHSTDPAVGRDRDRATVADFLRNGEGILLVEGAAGQGKTSLLRSVLADLQGVSSDGPVLPPVATEPVVIG